MAETKHKVREVNGYRLIYEPSHSSSMKGGNWNGYVYEHIFIAESHLHRRLRDNEVAHHLDGNKKNNRIENIIVLEKSQHAKLHRWIENSLKKQAFGKTSKIRYCLYCDKTLQKKQMRFCSSECLVNSESMRKTTRPPMSELKKDMSEMSMVKIGKKYGVSDNAVRKWAKGYNLL